MKNILLILFLLTNCFLFAQKKETDEILEEGKLLYRLEKGSWNGTDHFLANFENKKDSIGGYLSYETENHKINTVFFNRFNEDKVLIRYQFDSLPKTAPIKLDTINTKVKTIENSLRTMLNDARTQAQKNTDEFFSFYNNTSLNFIPLINKKERKVLVLTGPKISGVVLIGNDYQLNYNKKNELKDKFKIHNTILQFPYKSKDKENPTVSTVHSHINSEFISSTDICTLLLYKDYVEWNQHIVVSDTYVSLFDLKKETLVSLTKEAWEKINNHKND
ncbi:hypothetical protein FBALC1_05638 [Flavobacteriales bacterium ALC-1]|nr:hypothetical protein FBALC1_05638 [Flavobacteriales bacterium ALC-1]